MFSLLFTFIGFSSSPKKENSEFISPFLSPCEPKGGNKDKPYKYALVIAIQKLSCQTFVLTLIKKPTSFNFEAGPL